MKQENERQFWTAREKHTREADDPRIERIWLFAKEIARNLDADDQTKDEVDFFADRILDKLESALMYYQLIKVSDFDSRDISQKRTIYEGLYSNLWSFYKGRIQNFLKVAGWDLAIFFCREPNFEKEAARFIEQFPQNKELVELARQQRKTWQGSFAQSRNSSEHSGDYRDGVETYENKGDAQRLFAQVCWTAETLLAYCGSYRLKRQYNVIEENEGLNIFQDGNRYIVEHSLQTAMREKRKNNKKS